MAIKCGLDIDDTLLDFWGQYVKRFPRKKDLIDHNITKNVNSLQKDKEFWESLPKIREINCNVSLYCTKRINPKTYTRNSLKKNNFPDKPIYQMVYQKGNKARMIKGKVDVFIDDSVSNVMAMNKSGVPTLLIDHPNNRHFDFIGRIYSLDQEEIEQTYLVLKQNLDKLINE